MQTDLRGKHLITLQEWTREEIDTLLDIAFDLKRRKALGEKHHLLEDKTFYMLFFDNSTRTRNAFETGMTQLGGHAIYLTPKTTQIGHGETPKDTVEVLGRFGNGIGVRNCTYKVGNAYMRELAKYSKIPVINMQCDLYHPTQALADIMTIQEKFGKNTRGLNFTISWTYAPKYIRPLSMPQSLILLMSRFGMNVTLAHPPEFHLLPEFIEQAKKTQLKTASSLILSMIWTKPARTRTLFTPRAGAQSLIPVATPKAPSLSTSTPTGSWTAGGWLWVTRKPFTCTACRLTGALK